MVYPTTVMVVAIAVVVLLLVKVIPVFEKMFKDFGGELPGPDADRHRHLALAADWIVPFLIGRRASARSSPSSRRAGARRASGYQTDAIVPEAPGLRAAAAEGRGGALHAHARHHDLVAACRSSTRSRSCAKTAGNMRDRARRCRRRAAAIAEGKTIAEPLKAVGRLPGHGRADDRASASRPARWTRC